MNHVNQLHSPETVQAEARQFQLVVRLLFVIFLFVAALSRLLPPRWRPLRNSPGGQLTLIGEARSAANFYAPYAFIGY